MIESRIATVYQGARRRYFTKEAAARSFARAVLRRHCECERAQWEDGYQVASDYTCDLCKDVERCAKLVDYLARRNLRTPPNRREP